MLLFALFAEGYPAAMAILCTDHIGTYIENDQSKAFAPANYILKLTTHGPCRVCVSR